MLRLRCWPVFGMWLAGQMADAFNTCCRKVKRVSIRVKIMVEIKVGVLNRNEMD